MTPAPLSVIRRAGCTKPAPDRRGAISAVARRTGLSGHARLLEHLDKAEYIKSYKLAANDKDILSIAEEGMTEYLSQIKE